MNEELQKKSLEYAKEHPYPGVPIEIQRRAYEAGANAYRPKWHCTKDGDFPKEACDCLVRRSGHGRSWMELMRFDGNYWITGIHDEPDAVIEAWIGLEDLAE